MSKSTENRDDPPAETPLNVNPAEVSKFDDLASKWWDTNSEFKPLHDINPIRLDYITSFTSLADKSVLDVGCGGGILSEALGHAGAIVTGIDMAEKSLQVAKLHQHTSKLSIDYQLATIESYAQHHAQEFDIITCLEVLEHVPDPASVVNASHQLLKPGGQLFFSTINRTPTAYLMAVIGAEYLLKMLPAGTHDYEKFIKPSELASWLRQTGFTLNDVSGMRYNPLTKTYKLSNNTSVNYFVYASC